MRHWLLAGLALLGAVPAARADLVTRAVEYRHGAAVLEGCLVCDSAAAGRRPTVLLAHDSGGNSPAARRRAVQLAGQGYAVFCLDLFGKGVTPKDRQDAAARLGLSGPNRDLIRGRAEAGLAAAVRQPQVDPKRVAAVGYGVGGTAVLELARTGADLEGVVCVHGNLSTPNPADGKKITAPVLVLVGSDDPLVPVSQMTAFETEMRQGGVDWQVIRYGGAANDFTNPQAGRNLASGAAYDADADRRAAEAIKSFLAEVLAASPVAAQRPAPTERPAPANAPAKVLQVLKHVDEKGNAPEGYEGGRTFLNAERLLPQTDAQGRRIRYREWDVNPLRPGVNRGPERLVTGSDGSAYYTLDHYRTFKKIR